MSPPPDALKRYREKRDFSRTSEPAGTPARPRETLAFVVQRHAARRLHYDLRLEWRGVMKSWAVTRGPSLDPADKRLAVEVEDHPLDYASFEGTIPKPSYGGGTVQVWDRGQWRPRDPKTVDEDLAKGELKFELSGERLHGGFVLVRMRPRRGETETRHNWLLIKERDNAATPGAGDAVLKADTSVLSGRTMEQIDEGSNPAAADNVASEEAATAGEKSRARPARKRAEKLQPKSPLETPATPGEIRPPDAMSKRITSSSAGNVTISHPDRVLWPATSGTPPVTKADLAAYYERYADRILAQAGGRPLSVLRAPDGITGQLFFQRHATRGQSSRIGTVAIAGQAKPFLRVDDAAGLRALAQISAVELHPWGARAETPDLPDRIVFDLDPDAGLDFDAVIDAGAELRARLKTLGLTAFARVTGGKGLHIVVPVLGPKRAAPLAWAEAKQFAHLVCVMMERDAPGSYTTTPAKRSRKGKIFLDYLRNDRLATAIAGWSPRGRPGAPIARPVSWTAIKPGLDPAGWHLSELLSRVPERDPWSVFDAAAGDLRAAIVKATKA